MKKQISVITLIPRSSRYYAAQVQELFGNVAEVRSYSTSDRSVEKVGASDLYLVSTDAFEEDEARQYVPADGQVVEIQVTYPRSVIQELKKIPRGTRVLFVNATHQMAREAVTQLEQLGVSQVRFIPYGPDTVSGGHMEQPPAQFWDEVDMVVTPDEESFVPSGSKKILNIGHRPCTSGTMIEAAIRLGMEELLEEKCFQNYMKSMSTENYSFEQMFLRSQKLESRFDLLLEILDEGMIGVNEKGEIFACNQKAREITGIRSGLIIGQQGERIFPYIPFHACMKEKTMRPARLIRIGAANINMTVAPVLRHGECIGAFATLQLFSELERRQNELRSQLLHKGYRAKYCFEDVIGCSQAIEKTKAILRRMAATESPVLLIGETGTGKELFAHAVHQASGRSGGPFVAINVAAMPENLLESELFGYEDGAFTGAKKGGRPGLFEFAHKGTLFLDEVEGMSQAMQVKLLRVLQEREIMRVGGNQIINVDVRLVAATNESLEDMVEKGTFRRDLYYRLNTLPALIPPLRERGDDILLLMDNFRRQTGGSFELSEEVRSLFLHYRWPGNIRELRNVVEYLSFTGQRKVGIEDLPATFMRSMQKEITGFVPGEYMPRERVTQRSTPQRDMLQEGMPQRAEAQSSEAQSPEAQSPEAGKLKLQMPDTAGPEFWFVLEQLYRASQQGTLIGREAILSEARRQYIPLSQKEVRDILGQMAGDGLIKMNRGRGGSRLMPAGRSLWEAYRTKKQC